MVGKLLVSSSEPVFDMHINHMPLFKAHNKDIHMFASFLYQYVAELEHYRRYRPLINDVPMTVIEGLAHYIVHLSRRQFGQLKVSGS